ncbi:MAG: hypothetical protein HGA35_01830 [Erysipelotrichaceae bacterium]|nr:hypothetical protein [Erysipelotrichaceae bacterium]
MLKKLASLLFEEEEEIVEEELSVKEEPVKKEKSLITSMNPKPIEKPIEKVIEEPVYVQEVEIEHKAVEEIIKPVKSEFGIAFDEPTPVREKPKVVKEKPIYEFKPVISPMFGVSESKKAQAVRPANNPPQSVKKSRINTVISPFYGDIENRKDVSTPKVHQPVLRDPLIEDVTRDLPKYKAENYSLDDLLSPIKPQDDVPMVNEAFKDEEDELSHQISLFDVLK